MNEQKARELAADVIKLHRPDYPTVTSELVPSPLALGTGSAGLVLSGCKAHPHRTDLSCCKIRRPDGSPLSVAETWAEIQRLREGIRACLAENAHLADGDDCTLIGLKRLLLPNS